LLAAFEQCAKSLTAKASRAFMMSEVLKESIQDVGKGLKVTSTN
jgi:DNA-directed RNA polymerase specialized sigma24 family protein